MKWFLLCLFGASVSNVVGQIPAPPLPAREFRGAWIATVGGTDFPRKAGAPAAEQQAELLSIIERAAALRLNALIFQVRPMGDAFYKSEIEPWSPYLTGAMGKPPNESWDPLEFAIKEAHARGIELHAWFNPFRALAGDRFTAAGNHILKEHPEWCWRYGKDVWMDPGEPGVRQRAKAVMLDVLRRYDVDGIHLDDYFYPYPIKQSGATVEFPDQRTWLSYRGHGGTLDIQDWRRSNIDTFVQEAYESVKKVKPCVVFGISPFGLWRPNFPSGLGKGALDSYNDIAADSLKWLRNGWCDYFSPQLYWPISENNLSFTSLFDWWLSQNPEHRHIWPGMASDRVLSDRQPSEILREISVTREHQSTMPCGHIHWNFGALSSNRGKLADLVDKRAYNTFALPPSSPWLGNFVPPQPTITLEKAKAEWRLTDGRFDEYVKWWLVQTFRDGTWKALSVLPSWEKMVAIPLGTKAVAIRAIGLTGMAGDVAVVR